MARTDSVRRVPSWRSFVPDDTPAHLDRDPVGIMMVFGLGHENRDDPVSDADADDRVVLVIDMLIAIISPFIDAPMPQPG